MEEGGAVKMGGAAGFRFRNQKKIRQGPLWLFRPEGIECNLQQLFHDFRLRKKSIHASSNMPGLRIGCNYSLFRLPLRASFRIHVAAARETGLPVIVHSCNAEADTARILIDEYRDGAYRGLLHCFSATRQLAEKALEIDFRISFSGIVTFKNAEEVRETARTVAPLDRLLLETDSPFLAPVPHRGKTNEPAYVAHTADKVAELRGIPVAALVEATTANFYDLFTKAVRPDRRKDLG